MRFLAKYIPWKNAPEGSREYYRIVYADSVNEASKLAERYTRKGYICKEVKQQY